MCEPLLLALKGMRYARVLFRYTVFDDVFRMTGFESAGIDRFAISLFAGKPDGFEKSDRSAVAAGLEMWESRRRFPSLALVARRHLQAGHAQTASAKSDGRYLSPLASTAQAIRASLFARATTATLRWRRDTICSIH